MVELLAGAGWGLALKVAYEGGKYTDKVYKRSDIKDLEKTLNGLLPITDEILEVSLKSTSGSLPANLQEFQKKLEKARSRNPFKKPASVKKMEIEITECAQNKFVPTIGGSQIKLLNCPQDTKDSFAAQLQSLSRLIQNLIFEQEIGFNNATSVFDEKGADFAGQTFEILQRDRELCSPPVMSSYIVRFEKHIEELTKTIVEHKVDVLGITAVGGAGKSVLATSLCHQPEIKEYFKERVIYIVVSGCPDLLTILKTMWRNIVGRPEPKFRNVEDAHNKLQFQIESRRNEPILVVLDDICAFSHLKQLLFKGEKYMTILTTRDEEIINSIPRWFNKDRYPLPLLQEEDALSLFCRYAFDKPTIPDTHDEELVKQVQAQCKGLPLALEVIGKSLYGEPDSVWKYIRDAVPTRAAREDDLLERLKYSINVLSLSEKQCFLDLAVFPEGRRIPANVLLDIWVYVRRMNRNEAVRLLREFGDRHLLDLKRDPWNTERSDDCMSNYSVSQHCLLRKLAMLLAEQDNQIRFRRLYMLEQQSELPLEWQTEGNPSHRAQIVSIHTGKMDTQWPNMEFPEAEALLLYFDASEYCIPTFLDTMKKLKALIIYNGNAKQAKLSGLAGFEQLSQLKTLHLERLIVPPLHDGCKSLRSLQKISLSLCEGLGKHKIFNFPALSEFNLDHCSDLEELSAGICCSESLQILSITNCSSLAKLPDDLGKLGSLKRMRLCKNPRLKELPPSIDRFGKLKLLDISFDGEHESWIGENPSPTGIPKVEPAGEKVKSTRVDL